MIFTQRNNMTKKGTSTTVPSSIYDLYWILNSSNAIDKGYIYTLQNCEIMPSGKVFYKTNNYSYYTGVDGLEFTSKSQYLYDELGNISSTLHGSVNSSGTIFGDFTYYSYEKGRLSKVQIDGSDIKNTADSSNVKYEFYADGKLKSVSFPSLSDGTVLKSEYTYNGLSRLQTLTNYKGTTVLSSYSYTYDNNGNILTVNETVEGIEQETNFTYDKLNRIATVSGTKGADSYYEYDECGNRKASYEQIDFLSEENVEYIYTEENKLFYAETDDNATQFDYNADGYRFVKNSSSSNLPVFYIYDEAGRLMSEVLVVVGDNQLMMHPVRQYIWGPNRVLAQRDIYGNCYYYLYNGHGDVVQIVDTSGNIVNRYDYDVWGNFLKKEETIDNPFTYFGQTYDEETGLYYLRARYYDPTTGRFTQQDPAEDGYNWYVYGNQNPVMYVDVNGNSAIAAAEAFLNSPIGQQMYQYIANLANQAGTSITNYVVQNFPIIQKASNYISQYGVAVWDWTTNTAVPWMAEKAQQAGQAISDTADKAGNWIKEKWNNAINGDPNKKPSLKTVNNKTANDIAKKNGFNDAHDFKENIVGKSNISKFNIKIDKNTGEIFLESVKKGGSIIATGYYK